MQVLAATFATVSLFFHPWMCAALGQHITGGSVSLTNLLVTAQFYTFFTAESLCTILHIHTSSSHIHTNRWWYTAEVMLWLHAEVMLWLHAEVMLWLPLSSYFVVGPHSVHQALPYALLPHEVQGTCRDT